MDKKTFISELRQALSVLQEDELEDIVSEYEQHIDMKLKNGLTEEEAIADFGRLNELAADILEADHVRADYASKSKTGRGAAFSRKGEDGKALQEIKNLCQGTGISLISGIGSLGNVLWSVLVFCKNQVVRPFRWMKKQWEERSDENVADRKNEPDCQENDMEEDSGLIIKKEGRSVDCRSNASVGNLSRRISHKSPKRLIYGGMGSLLRRLVWLILEICRLAGRAALWGIRMIWNGSWVCFVLFSGGCGLISLYMLGMLAVLLMQRYPLAGVTLGCLGLVLCFFSAAGLGMTFLWRKTDTGSTGCRAGAGQGAAHIAGGADAGQSTRYTDGGASAEQGAKHTVSERNIKSGTNGGERKTDCPKGLEESEQKERESKSVVENNMTEGREDA